MFYISSEVFFEIIIAYLVRKLILDHCIKIMMLLVYGLVLIMCNIANITGS